MPTCSKCHRSDVAFATAKDRTSKRTSQCLGCRAEYQRDYMKGNVDAYRMKFARVKRVRRKNYRRVFNYLLEHPCVDCGEKDPLVLEFDHVRGEKRREVSKLLCAHYSWATIRAEIRKCVVRCANCHRRKTHRDGDYARYRYFTKWLKQLQSQG